MSFAFWLSSLKARVVAASARRNRNSRRSTIRQRSLLLETLEDRVVPATLLVNTNADVVNPTNGTLSLRDAISAVNAGNANGLTAGEMNQVSGTFGVNDTIEFSSTLTGDTITLDGSALPTITKSLTITGLGGSNLAISGNDESGVFNIAGSTTVSISGMTIEDGNAPNGGGIYDGGALAVNNCILVDNSAASTTAGYGDGGGIYFYGLGITLTVSNCTLTGNSATNAGGGIFIFGFLTVSGCTLSDNSASSGGGIYNSVVLTVSSCTLSDNSASGASYFDGGGGICNGLTGMLTVSNCTLADNSANAGEGGGILNLSELGVTNSTLSGNSAKLGGGISNKGGITGEINGGGPGQASLNNTIVANNTSGGDLYLNSSNGSTFTGAYDLIGDGSDLSSFSHSLQGNPLLAPLANNGGPTQTLALLPGSPALDAGSSALAVDANGNPLTTDQRGKPRIVDGSVDIGAFERQVNNSIDSLGAYRPSDGSWSLASAGTLNYNDTTTLSFNPSTNQVFFSFSPPGAIGVAGDWTGSGVTEIGDFQIVNGVGIWALDLNDNGILVPSDTFTFGQTGDTPVVGDWNGDGKTDLGVFRATPDGSGGGEFILDTNENHILDAGDATFNYGLATDRVVIGDWNGAGKSEVGVFRDAGTSGFPNDAGDAVFSLDVANHRTFDSSNQVFLFGRITDGLIVGDWNGQGKTDLGVYRDGASFGAPGTALFSLDTLGNHEFGPGDAVFLYGVDTDQFVSGHWAKTPPLQPEGTPQAQFAANGSGSGGVAPLTEAQLQPVVDQAIAAWVVDGASAAQLDSVPVQIGTLDDNLVGETSGNQITLDATADGWGWNTDTFNADFTTAGTDGFQATPGSAAAGQLDLLTVVEHELGHELGLSDVDPTRYPSSLMASTLPVGTRRTI